MNPPNVVYGLAMLVGILAVIATGIGLFWNRTGNRFTFATLRGQTAEIYGRGIYHYETVFFGAGFKGQDAVVLFLGVPLLGVASLWSADGALAGHLLLTGTFGYFLYVYASMALGTVFNRLFIVYVTLFSASLFALVLMLASVDETTLAQAVAADVPRNSLAIFLIISGVVTLFVWGMPVLDAVIKDTAPDRTDSYTTMVTHVLDLGVITPSTFLAGALILQEEAFGYAIATPLLVLIILLTPQIALSTFFQRAAGVPFTTPEIVGPVGGFVVLGLLALGLLALLLGGVA